MIKTIDETGIIPEGYKVVGYWIDKDLKPGKVICVKNEIDIVDLMCSEKFLKRMRKVIGDGSFVRKTVDYARGIKHP